MLQVFNWKRLVYVKKVYAVYKKKITNVFYCHLISLNQLFSF